SSRQERHRRPGQRVTQAFGELGRQERVVLPPQDERRDLELGEPGSQADETLAVEVRGYPGEALHAVVAVEGTPVLGQIGVGEASAVPHPGVEEAVEPRPDE